MRAIRWIQSSRAWALVLFAVGATARAAAPEPAPAASAPAPEPLGGSGDREEFQLSISMMGAQVAYGDTPFAFEGGAAGDLPGVSQMVPPFGGAPFSGLRAYGLRVEERGVMNHVRFGLGFQMAFPRWRLADVSGAYPIAGVDRLVSASSVSSKDVRLSLGLNLPVGPVHLYSDLVGTLRFLTAKFLVDGAQAKFGAITFAYAVEAGASVKLDDELRLGLQVERGLVGEQAWGASLALILILD